MAGGTDNLLKIGEKFGIYDVVRELGHGGMGAVYLVRDPRDGSEFAAKVMYPESPAAREYFVKRFIREAEIAMAVRHPNLIRVYDVGRDPDTGLGYMLMDYVQGGSLKERLMRRLMDGKGPFPVQEALQIVRQVAEALDAAAERGIVHRDVKPDNILFAADGTPKLADLGVAKVSDGDASTLLTMSNVVVGTPAYMAPEQMTNSHAVDSRADVYSLGIVLWEILAGERPTAGASAAELMARAVRGDRIPDIRTKRKGLPAYVIELIRAMTEPKVERRIESPMAVIRFLSEWRERERRRMRAWLIGIVAVGGLLLLAILCGGIWYIKATPQEPPPLVEPAVSYTALPSIADVEDEIAKERRAKKETAAEAAAPSEAVAPPKPVALPDRVASLVDEFRSAHSRGGEADRIIVDAVNAARKIDSDLASFELDGQPVTEGGKALSSEEAAIYRRGVVFLRLEMFRRAHGRLPTDSEIRNLFDR